MRPIVLTVLAVGIGAVAGWAKHVDAPAGNMTGAVLTACIVAIVARVVLAVFHAE